ncbi:MULTISPECIES: hypothetical protein [Burkholderia]|uniref:hypothetical protein n=1 Tax=Burkholderia TaxID=32008 RepID=UPI00158E862B|nr:MULTISPECIES: hypothetical protein [Burkholderia]MBR8208967.1 hypothetical protein [Burkholderia cenocepacia]MCA8234835.1 hypothetical protein [Burkholderia cenocepacia]
MTIPVNQWQILLFRKIDSADCPLFPSKSPKNRGAVFAAPHNPARRLGAESHRGRGRAARPLHVVITA